ncbi:MAG: DNA repair protein RecN, partial [Oscillospiraceae bacterium]
MLATLNIENIAIIKKAVVEFKDGFNVMTGETGAGKSIIIDSINAVLGERTSRELIRTGADFASVSALFDCISDSVKCVLSEFDIDCEDDNSLLIQRKIYADGKNICKINGSSATVSMLKKIGKQLINIHGQLDNQTLLNAENHCSYVDKIAENNDLLNNYHQIYFKYLNAKSELKKLNMDEAEKVRKLDLLNYQIDEIENSNIRIGEFVELQNELNLYRNSEKIVELLSFAHSELSGDETAKGSVQMVLDASSKLQTASVISENFTEIHKKIEECAYNLSEYTDELRDMLFSLDFDPLKIETLEERIDVLYKLFKKYGSNEEEILNFLDNAVSERDNIENFDNRKNELEIKTNKLYEEALSLAKELSNSRIIAADFFSKEVMQQLKFLDMPSVKFIVKNDVSEISENGIDNIEFLLSANAGEIPKPLAKIASGGELSRIMLAIKSALADKDDISTLIFDEIDTGVSGRAAQKIAFKLKDVSKNHQVI